MAVLEDKIIILTSEGKVFEYSNGTLKDISIQEVAIDIQGKGNNLLIQTVNENTYMNNAKVAAHGDNTFGIGVRTKQYLYNRKYRICIFCWGK